LPIDAALTRRRRDSLFCNDRVEPADAHAADERHHHRAILRDARGDRHGALISHAADDCDLNQVVGAELRCAGAGSDHPLQVDTGRRRRGNGEKVRRQVGRRVIHSFAAEARGGKQRHD
jgi:hypothetical protein